MPAATAAAKPPKQAAPAAVSAGTARAAVSASTARVKRVPQRTCVACRTTGGKKGLLRVVRLSGEAGGVALDPTGKVSGRGAYVCASLACVGLAIKQKKLERSLKSAVPAETADALKTAAEAAEKQAKRAEQAV